jgi:hypothetical protein
MANKNEIFGMGHDGINPLGPKRPLAFLAPTLRLMAVGESIVTAKFPEGKILSIAKSIGIGVRLTVDKTSIRITRMAGKVNAPYKLPKPTKSTKKFSSIVDGERPYRCLKKKAEGSVR